MTKDDLNDKKFSGPHVKGPGYGATRQLWLLNGRNCANF